MIMLNTMLKNLISLGLCFTFLDSIIHNGKYGRQFRCDNKISKIDCGAKQYYTTDHLCQNCYKKNQNIYSAKDEIISYNLYVVEKFTTVDLNYFELLIFDLQSRPPPNYS